MLDFLNKDMEDKEKARQGATDRKEKIERGVEERPQESLTKEDSKPYAEKPSRPEFTRQEPKAAVKEVAGPSWRDEKPTQEER